MESNAVDPTKWIDSVKEVLFDIVDHFPPHEVRLGLPVDRWPLTYSSAEN